jgi:hypothetical protein
VEAVVNKTDPVPSLLYVVFSVAEPVPVVFAIVKVVGSVFASSVNFGLEAAPPEAVSCTGLAVAQMAALAGATVKAVGSALTVTAYVTAVPVQPFAFGVIVMIALPVRAVNEGTEVTPAWFGKPMAAPPVMSNVTPLGVPESTSAEATSPWQYIWADGAIAVGVGLTKRTTASLVAAGPQVGVIKTSYDPEFAGTKDVIVSVGVVALALPVMSTPSFLHWYIRPAPVAATVNVAVSPWHLVSAIGCVVMLAPLTTLTVVLPVAEQPVLLVTVTVYVTFDVTAVATGLASVVWPSMNVEGDHK